MYLLMNPATGELSSLDPASPAILKLPVVILLFSEPLIDPPRGDEISMDDDSSTKCAAPLFADLLKSSRRCWWLFAIIGARDVVSVSSSV